MELRGGRLEQVLQVIGLSAPAQGRAHYFASRAAVALAVAVLTMLTRYGLATLGAISRDSPVGAVVVLIGVSSYALALWCLIGYWSVSSGERRAEGLLQTHDERTVLTAGWVAAALGSVALAGLVLATHLG